MSDSPAEYVDKLKARVRVLEASLEKIATLKPSESNAEAIEAFFTARRTAREALGK